MDAQIHVFKVSVVVRGRISVNGSNLQVLSSTGRISIRIRIVQDY